MDTGKLVEQSPGLPSNVAELLLSVSSECARLDREANTALHSDRDPSKHHGLMKQRAELIAKLPERIEEIRASGIEVPTEVDHLIASLSGMAKEEIEADNLFGMSVLLTPRGSTEGDRDLLEEAAHKLQNPEV